MSNNVIQGFAEEELKHIDRESIDLIITDIPYGISFKSNKQNLDTRNGSKIKKERKDYFCPIIGDGQIPTEWLKEAFRVLKNDSAFYSFCHWSKWHLFYPEVEEAGFQIKNMIVINKSNHGMGDLDGQYAPKHELLMFAVKGRHILNFADKRMNDVWDGPVKYSGSVRYHPNQQPMSWIEPIVLNSSHPGDVILDPFCGSGTTGVVANKWDRKYYLIEADHDHVKTAKKRLEESEYDYA